MIDNHTTKITNGMILSIQKYLYLFLTKYVMLKRMIQKLLVHDHFKRFEANIYCDFLNYSFAIMTYTSVKCTHVTHS